MPKAEFEGQERRLPPSLNVFLRDEGIVGMLKEKYMNNWDNISPFIGAIVDRAWRESKDAHVTSVLTMYIDLMKNYVGMKSAYSGTGGASFISKNQLRNLKRK